MSNNIPTAEEFLESRRIYPHMKAEWECEAVYQEMIEFAKLHVKAQREDILKNIGFKETTSEILNSEEYKPFVTAEDGSLWIIDENLIKKAYPENLIQ